MSRYDNTIPFITDRLEINEDKMVFYQLLLLLLLLLLLFGGGGEWEIVRDENLRTSSLQTSTHCSSLGEESRHLSVESTSFSLLLLEVAIMPVNQPHCCLCVV